MKRRNMPCSENQSSAKPTTPNGKRSDRLKKEEETIKCISPQKVLLTRDSYLIFQDPIEDGNVAKR